MISITGGNLADLPQGMARKWDGKPRPVKVTINSWLGIAPGARHYYVNLEEAENPFVGCDCKGDGEVHEHGAWDDGDRRGETDRFGFMEVGECLMFIDRLKRWIDPARYELLDLDDPDYWDGEHDLEIERKLHRETSYVRDFR